MTTQSTNIPLLSYRKSEQQDCLYRGKTLIVPSTFERLWGRNNINIINK